MQVHRKVNACGLWSNYRMHNPFANLENKSPDLSIGLRRVRAKACEASTKKFGMRRGPFKRFAFRRCGSDDSPCRLRPFVCDVVAQLLVLRVRGLVRKLAGSVIAISPKRKEKMASCTAWPPLTILY